MTSKTFEKLRTRLNDLARQVQGNTRSLEEQAQVGLGGDSGGNLSNTPMHLGDLGSAAYTQELNTTLLENERFIRDEVADALGRMDRGVYGRCENCRAVIPAERLDALPYARYCTKCAAELQAGRPVNLNDGRPDRADWPTPARPAVGPDPVSFPEQDAVPPVGDRGDRHAAGTAGGGTAVGGLAGTNIGTGDPDEADLEAAMGSSTFDADLAGKEADEAPNAYSGHAGGAVGGTPANKRAVGGTIRGGISPRPDPGDSPTGQ